MLKRILCATLASGVGDACQTTVVERHEAVGQVAGGKAEDGVSKGGGPVAEGL